MQLVHSNQPLLILFTCRIKKQSYDDLNQWIKFEIRYDFLCATGYYLIKILSFIYKFQQIMDAIIQRNGLRSKKKPPKKQPGEGFSFRMQLIYALINSF